MWQLKWGNVGVMQGAEPALFKPMLRPCAGQEAAVFTEGVSTEGAGRAFCAVLFDLGGTLIHFSTRRIAPYFEATISPMHARLREMGFAPPPLGTYSRIVRNDFLRQLVWSRIIRREVLLVEAFRRLHRKMGMEVSEQQIPELMELCVGGVWRLASVDPKATCLLLRLKELGLKLGVVSNSFFPGAAIDLVLKREGLLDLFPVRVYSCEVGYMKPDRRIFSIALERLGIAAPRVLYVGDRISKDVVGGRRAGIKTALLSPKRRSRFRWRSRPDYVIHSLGDLESIVTA